MGGRRGVGGREELLGRAAWQCDGIDHGTLVDAESPAPLLKSRGGAWVRALEVELRLLLFLVAMVAPVKYF